MKKAEEMEARSAAPVTSPADVPRVNQPGDIGFRFGQEFEKYLSGQRDRKKKNKS